MKDIMVQQCLVERTTGKVIGVFDEIAEKDGLYVVRIGENYGVYNSNGRAVLPMQYDSIQVKDGYIYPTKSHAMGLCDYDGNFIIEPGFEFVGIRNGFILLYDGESYGLADIHGKLLLDFHYSSITVLAVNSFVALWRNGHCSIYFTKTDRVAPVWGDKFDFDQNRITLYRCDDQSSFTYDIMGNHVTR